MRVGIIGAMDEEVKLLLERMTDKNEVTVANSLFIEGKLNDKHVVLLKSGIGKVNAAMTTTIMHERFQPTYVINTGSAGGFSKELNIGDIVISTEVIHHDVDATAFNYTYGQVPGMPASYAANPELIKHALAAVAQLNLPHTSGLIATGDSFMADLERVNAVKEKFPNIIAAEMEAAAIAQVCYQYDVPFVVIRALSDIAGKDSSVSFAEFLEQASKNATALIIEMIKLL